MKVYVVKFSNGLYIINPYFAFGVDSVDGVYTKHLNKARLTDDAETARRMAEDRLDRADKVILGCTYEIVEVKIVEA